jgi:hypothetical protein
MIEVWPFLQHIRDMLVEEQEKLDRLKKMQEQLDRDPMFGDHIRRNIRRVAAELEETRSAMEELAITFLQIPPWHGRHRTAIHEFNRVSTYNESVFVMTKFPDGNTEQDAELSRVIQAVKEALIKNGLIPRIADGARYHDWVWDEVELHLLGCSQGVAIIEDKYKPELNPNVAMEWGWMRAMGKRVLFLQEANFSHGRADLAGLRCWKFDWQNPEAEIYSAVDQWRQACDDGRNRALPR